MTDPVEVTPTAIGRAPAPARRHEPANLADILERVLDKGIVIAGDIQINLLDIELLTIKLRLIVASVDRAKEMGIDWWEHDPTLSSRSAELASRSAEVEEVEEENRQLRQRISALEAGDDRGSSREEQEDFRDREDFRDQEDFRDREDFRDQEDSRDREDFRDWEDRRVRRSREAPPDDRGERRVRRSREPPRRQRGE